jgi:hypothetical protein
MFEFTETIAIEAAPVRMWGYLLDIEEWWPRSNPEHDSIEVLDEDSRLGVGTRIRIRERVAGIPGEAVGRVTEYVEGQQLTWESDNARYSLWGIPLRVEEGVRWSLRPAQHGVDLSATVWAVFPRGPWGRLVEWLFKGPLDGVNKDRQHARRELEYLKHALER